MIKVCYIQHGSEYGIIKRLAKYLKGSDIEFVFVARSRLAFEQYKKDGFESYYFSEVIRQKSNFSEEELRELDLKYGPYGIKAICGSDPHIRFLCKNADEQAQLIARTYKFWEKFFSDHRPSYILITLSAGYFPIRTALNVARAYGIPLGNITGVPGHGYFSIADMGEEICWTEFEDAIKRGPRDLSEEERRLTMEFISGRIGKNPIKVDFMSESTLARIREFIGLVKEIVDAKLREDPYTVGVCRFAIHKLFTRSLWKYVTSRFTGYDKPALEPYVYFPLFSKNEVLNVANYHYWTENQISLIQETAESLPSGFKLYIKEHPQTPGEFSYGELKKLRKISNVRILQPALGSHAIIEGCSAVVVLNGTAGWEAYLNKKPVVMLGHMIYFARSRLIYKVGSPSDLRSALFGVIKEGTDIYSKNEQEWLWFIHSIISTCGKGIYTGSQAFPDEVDEEENCKKMAKFIGDKICSTSLRTK